MLGIPVECQAVETSPQGIVIAWRFPRCSPKSISRASQAIGTGTILPSRRMAPACGRLSIIVFCVPRLIAALSEAKARTSSVASGSATARWAARQSLGTTSKPTPGRSATPASRACSPRARTFSKTAISPVMSR